jgi:hypothetical protein
MANVVDRYDVMILCPSRKSPVRTGFSFTLEEWADLTLPKKLLRCTVCSGLHEWAKSDAWLHKPRRKEAERNRI